MEVRADLGDGPEDGGVYLGPRTNDCASGPCADAVLPVLSVHAQPVQRMPAQQAQRIHYRQADICTHCPWYCQEGATGNTVA